jgi:hypothetical protein
VQIDATRGNRCVKPHSGQPPVQIVMDVSNVMTAVEAPAQGSAKTTVKYRDWGVPVDIKGPPMDQVGEFPRIGG